MNRFRNNFWKRFDGQEQSVIENALWLAYKRHEGKENLTGDERAYKKTAWELLQEINPMLKKK